MSQQDYCRLLQDFLYEAPTPNGWARWCTAVWIARELQVDDQDTAKDVLMQLISICPRPSSYLRLIERLTRLEEVLGESYCVSCLRVLPVDQLTHRPSDRDMADIAGLVCPSCSKHIETGHKWPTSGEGLSVLEGTYRYKELRRKYGH